MDGVKDGRRHRQTSEGLVGSACARGGFAATAQLPAFGYGLGIGLLGCACAEQLSSSLWTPPTIAALTTRPTPSVCRSRTQYSAAAPTATARAKPATGWSGRATNLTVSPIPSSPCWSSTTACTAPVPAPSNTTLRQNISDAAALAEAMRKGVARVKRSNTDGCIAGPTAQSCQVQLVLSRHLLAKTRQGFCVLRSGRGAGEFKDKRI